MANVAVTQKTSIADQINQLRERIARRAYELFQTRDGWGDAVGDWLRAEEELASQPPIELREADGNFILAVALPGVDVKDIAVDLTPQDVVIEASARRARTDAEGQVYRCEFSSSEFFRSLSFPKTVAAMKAKAEYQDGMLIITVPVEDADAKRPAVEAA